MVASSQHLGSKGISKCWASLVYNMNSKTKKYCLKTKEKYSLPNFLRILGFLSCS